MPGADAPIQQCAGPFHSSVILLLKLVMKIRDNRTTVQFKIGLLCPFGSFPSKFMNSGEACQLWTRRLWQKQIYESNQKRTEVLPLVWWMCLNKSLLPLKLGGWRKWEESTWEIYLWCAMDPEWVNGPGGMEGSRLHPSASLTSVLPSSHSTEATGHGLSLDLVLRHSAWAEHGLTVSLH